MSGRWFFFSQPVVIPTYAQSYVDTLRWERRGGVGWGGGEGRLLEGRPGLAGAAGVTYSPERNMIGDNCKQRRVAWAGRSNKDTFHSHLPR